MVCFSMGSIAHAGYERWSRNTRKNDLGALTGIIAARPGRCFQKLYLKRKNLAGSLAGLVTANSLSWVCTVEYSTGAHALGSDKSGELSKMKSPALSANQWR